MLKNFVNYFLHILILQYFFNDETNLTLDGNHKSVITHLYYGYQICLSSNLYSKLPKGGPRDEFVEKIWETL
jgi:hypothetical protein